MLANLALRQNLDTLEAEYQKWLQNPQNVDRNTDAFFQGFSIGSERLAQNQEQVESEFNSSPTNREAQALNFDNEISAKIFSLIFNYRSMGHLEAKLDPLNYQTNATVQRKKLLDLNISSFALSENDLSSQIASPYFKNGKEMSVAAIIDELRQIYCSFIGYEYMHIQDREIRYWLRDEIETWQGTSSMSPKTKHDALSWILEAEAFEKFLEKNFIGEKRFSLEGGETIMAALNSLLENSPNYGISNIVMGMAHRGRLNVLANFLRKPIKQIFYEFSDNYIQQAGIGDGDVKYHLGFETRRKTSSGKEVGIYLAANPSHLEAVNSVVEGKARSLQRILNDTENRKKVLPILIHGDAAIAGQGSVAETINLSQLEGYTTGGTLHLIINNQIGFTTLPDEARSSSYCTDVAKMIEAPIFHVNGDHPLCVIFCAQLALKFRQKFGRDVFIDMYCYRRRGHNETDLAGFTQPKYDKTIRKHKSIFNIFRERLIRNKAITEEKVEAIEKGIYNKFDHELKELNKLEHSAVDDLYKLSTAMEQKAYEFQNIRTGIAKSKLHKLAKILCQAPPGFKLHRTLKNRILSYREKAFKTGKNFNWAMGEALAFASLLDEGVPIRLSGQDCLRGTFSHRHAAFFDTENNERYIPFKNISKKQASFCAYNSLLSEAAVLGFDYGYSIGCPEMLIIWEAQFGDFANGAQVIIDQFIASSESKWGQPSGIVMLLPHGYEGAGPEHSSARIERFLQLCAHNNMQVCNLTTPAQYYHVLRRQAKQEFRKPLIIATPKSLLGNPKAVSEELDFIDKEHFHIFLDDPNFEFSNKEKRSWVERLIFCSGKVYYDLRDHKEENPKIKNVAIIRFEQIYPFDEEALYNIILSYPNAKKYVWCQEEPQNMGAWNFLSYRLNRLLTSRGRIRFAGREAASSPATGSKLIHKYEQKQLTEEAFNS